MATEHSVSELVLRWQELRQQGQPASAEEMCDNDPELLDELKRRLRALAFMEAFLGEARPGVATTPERVTPTTDPLNPDPRQTVPDGRPQRDQPGAPEAGAETFLPGYQIQGELGKGGMG